MKEALEEVMKTLMAEQQHWLQRQMQEQNQKIDAQQHMMTQMLEQFRELGRNQIHQEIGNDHQPRSNLQFNPKIEFPGFDGHNPWEWIKGAPAIFLCVKLLMIRRLIWLLCILWVWLRNGLPVILSVGETSVGRNLLLMFVLDFGMMWEVRLLRSLINSNNGGL